MSYEPTLVIKRTSLEDQREKIEERVNVWENARSKDEKQIYLDQHEAYKALFDVLNWPEDKFVIFPEIELAIIRPELTTHNKDVRDLLTKLRIDFRINK